MIAVWIVLAALAGVALGVALCVVSLRAYVRQNPVIAFAIYVAKHPEKVAELRQALAVKAAFAHIATEATRNLNRAPAARGARATGVWVDEVVGADWLTDALRRTHPNYLQHRGDVR